MAVELWGRSVRMRPIAAPWVLLGPLLCGALACSGGAAQSEDEGGNSADPTGDAGVAGATNSGGSAGATGDPTGTSGLPECATRTIPLQPLRRLSSAQYHNTLRELFGAELVAPLLEGSLFPETVITAGFSGDAEANLVNTQESNAIEDNAERIAEQVLAAPEGYLTALMPCPITAATAEGEIDACIDAFISTFGARAYRRPITESELGLARRVYDEVRVDESAVSAWASVLQYFVQAPALLYRVERGSGPAALPGMVQLTGHELASRLSYFLLGSMPDAELLRAAEAGELSDVMQVTAQADRLMQSDAFLSLFGAFHRDWLELYELPTAKDSALFPGYTGEVYASLEQETEQFLRHQLNTPGVTLQALLSSPTGVVNSELAAFYGVTAAGASASTWVPVELPNRRGLLTQASLMATLAEANRTSAIHRGAFFRTQILCQVLPAVPGDVDTQGPLQDTSTEPTARGRLAPLTTRSDCAGCHLQINPIGLAFENYDAAGQWRTEENGAPIDSAGTISLDGTEHAFTGPLELVDALAGSAQVQACYSLQWYRAAQGRTDFEEDACGVAYVRDVAETSGGDVRQIVRAVVQTDAFLYRREELP